MSRKIALLASLGLTAIFGYLYYAQYFRWRRCFNELGRCFDAETGVVYLEQSGAIWLSLTALACAASLYQAWKLRKGRSFGRAAGGG